MQRLLLSPTELAMSAMGSEATPLCTLPLPPLPCTHQLPRQLLWLFTTITHQQLLPIPHLLLPIPPLLLPILLLLLPPQPTTMSPSLTPPMPSPMELEAAQTVRFIPTRSSPTATSTPSPTPRRTTTSTQSSPTTGPGCEADPTLSLCRTRGPSTWSTPRTRTATSPRSPTRALPSSLTSFEL